MSTEAFIIGFLICGGIAALIGQRKHFNVVHSFLLGAILGVIGIGIVAVQRPNLPKPPPGLVAVKCPRCTAVQNIPSIQAQFECWQCKLTSDVASARSRAAENAREWLDRTKRQD
jgi:hypothetical protein